MILEIENTANVLAQAQNIMNNSVQLGSVNNSLDYILSTLNAYWSQNQDQQTFATGLQESCEALRMFSECNKEFAQAITEYVESIESIGGAV